MNSGTARQYPRARQQASTGRTADPVTPASGAPTWSRWRTIVCSLVVAVAALLIVRTDVAQVRWVSELSAQGSPPPTRDATSPTGYALGQRHFLGQHERGETYRWIDATQDLIASGPFGARTYDGDSLPAGRPLPVARLYAAWVATVAWGISQVSGEPIALAVESAALWEPLVSHVLVFAAAVVFMARRFGVGGALATALCLASLPPFFGQFVPGTLTPRTWAMFLSAYAVAAGLFPVSGRDRHPFSARTAVAAGIALWLDPAWGFPAVLLSAAAGAVAAPGEGTGRRCLSWALLGGCLTFAGWLLDATPWTPAVGELRYVHPLYSLAWLGLGFAVDAARRLRSAIGNRAWAILEIAAAVTLVGALVHTQLTHRYHGWFYGSVWMRRITALDDTRAFETLFDWLRQASPGEVVLLSALPLGAVALLAIAARTSRPAKTAGSVPLAIVFGGLVVLTLFRLRWGVIASVCALPVIASCAPLVLRHRGIMAGATGVFVLALLVWLQNPPAGFTRPGTATEPSPADVEALLYRHFAHWLATHTPGEAVAVLAPPELSDCIVFHGNGRALLSTAWESYPGQLAARRILSALESTEAEAVLQGHGITHVILPSWDKVLPLFVQTPAEKGRDTLFERLDRWRYPAYLRPIPYRLPSTPVYVGQKLAVFKVTPAQDEPLLLSRLAEYFIEVERSEPAAMVARVLSESYPDDPNAAIALALVHGHAKDSAAFHRELERLVADTRAGHSTSSWDRRVQRAIVLALGRQRELARREIDACLAAATTADLLELTPLQAFRLGALTKAFGLRFASESHTRLAAALGAEYQQRQADDN